ncbi:hypothetical protein KC614_02565 [candidate division WWE3 bacterium]|uniref:Solute-binding protein family 5 domain-containing protein n=1 Tax=candidate division WWE3 bacterium TaxID=2053526 RepID=A0A955RR26_UNCKA|nr:hypothetical protein [candidate division WWE3 bacterium]
MRSRRFISLVGVVLVVVVASYVITSKLISAIQGITSTTTYAVVGQPGTFNPLLARTDTFDLAMSKILYRGLVTFDAKMQPLGDLAESWTISDDAKIYTVTIKQGQTWDDGEPITTQDIAYTYNFIKQNEQIKLHFPFVDGVDVNIVNNEKVEFVLDEAFSPFLSILQLGILPKHIWGEMNLSAFTSSKYNLQAVGSGAYKVLSITADNDEIQEMVLTPNNGSKQTLVFKFFDQESETITAFKLGDVDVLLNAGDKATETLSSWPNVNLISSSVCGETVTMFINQESDQRVSAKAAFRDALYAFIATSNTPLQLNATSLPRQHWAFTDPEVKTEITHEEATNNLLTFANADAPLIIGMGPDDVAQSYANELLEQLQGVGYPAETKEIALNTAEGGALASRDFDVVIFAQQFSQDPDQYQFWHSTQTDITSGGLNISGYSNRRMDKALEDARTSIDFNVRKDNYASMELRLFEDKPALFFAAPSVKTIARINKSPIVATQCIWSPSDYLVGDSN